MFLQINAGSNLLILVCFLWLLTLIYFFYDSEKIGIKELPEDFYHQKREEEKSQTNLGNGAGNPEDSEKRNFLKKALKYLGIVFGVTLAAVTLLIAYSYVSGSQDLVIYENFRLDFQEYVEITRSAPVGSYSYSNYFKICENFNLWEQKIRAAEAKGPFDKLLIVQEWIKDREAQAYYELLKVEVLRVKSL